MELAALAIQPPQQPDLLGQYGKMMQIKNLQQQGQMGALDIQEKQRQMAQTKALNDAYAGALTTGPDGQPTFDKGKVLSTLASSGQGSAIPGVTQHFLELDKLAGEVQKTKDEHITTSQDYLGALAKTIRDTNYDPRVAGTLLAHAASSGFQQEVQPILQQIQQNPGALKQIVDSVYAASPKQQQAYKDTQQGAEAQARIPGIQAEEARKAALAGPELQKVTNEAANPPLSESQLYLKAAGGDAQAKAAVDLQTQQKIKSRPINVTGTNLLQDPAALDQQAERFSQTGQLPAGFSRSPGTTAAIIKRAAELHPDQNLASNSAEFKANEGSLKKLQTNFDQVSAFESTAIKNLDLYLEKAKAVPDLGARFANVPLRMITGKMIGDSNQAALNAARQTATAEAAKVLASANASGVLSDSQKKDASDVLDGNLPFAASQKVVDTLKQDFANRHQSYQMQIGDIQKRMGGGGNQTTTNSQSGITVTDPNGGVHTFPDQASANKFKSLAHIQ